MDYTAEQINKAFDELPKITSKSIYRANIDEKTVEIIKKYGLDQETGNTLSTYITFVLIGLISIEDFGPIIINELGLLKEFCEKIIIDVNESIFKVVDEKVKELEEEEELFKEIEEGNKEIPISEVKKINPRFNVLPNNLQEAIMESHYKTKTYSIGQKYNLPIDQIGVLEEIINKTILGNIHPDKLENEIKSKIQIPNDKINELIADLNEEIFKEIRNLLKTQNELIAKEDEVPLPPYKEIIKNIDPITSVNGIEIINEERNKKIEPVVKEGDEGEIFKNSGIDIIEDKLNKMTVSDSTVSNYSLPRMSSVDKDPYREDFSNK